MLTKPIAKRHFSNDKSHEFPLSLCRRPHSSSVVMLLAGVLTPAFAVLGVVWVTDEFHEVGLDTIVFQQTTPRSSGSGCILTEAKEHKPCHFNVLSQREDFAVGGGYCRHSVSL